MYNLFVKCRLLSDNQADIHKPVLHSGVFKMKLLCNTFYILVTWTII